MNHDGFFSHYPFFTLPPQVVQDVETETLPVASSFAPVAAAPVSLFLYPEGRVVQAIFCDGKSSSCKTCDDKTCHGKSCGGN